MREPDGFFGSYVHLKHLPREAEALHTLRKVASCVKPIMRKRGWRVGTLCEFYPDQANLLGLNFNSGQRINVRLRYPSDINQFMPFDQVLDTVLHELVHNTQGDHNERFYRIWDELRDEWATLQAKGFTGEGFLGQGKVLGGRHIPNDELRRRARAAAIERQQSAVALNPGHRLGGTSYGGFYSRPNPAVIGAAAASRSTTSTSQISPSACGAGSKSAERAADEALRSGYRTTADMSEADEIAIQNALIELMEEEEERKLNGLPAHSSEKVSATDGLIWDPVNGLQAAGSGTSSSSQSSAARDSNPPPIPSRSKPSSNQTSQPRKLTKRSAPSPPSDSLRPTPDPLDTYRSMGKAQSSISSSSAISERNDTWPCPTCTLLNNGKASRCDACDQARPADTVRSSTVPKMQTSRRPPDSRASWSSRNPCPTASRSSNSMPTVPYKDRPLGWICRSCGTFMESQWWTCSFCGTMKDSS